MPSSKAVLSADESALAAAFDCAALVERCAGDRALARELAGLYLGSVDEMMAAVERAIESKDASALECAAHGLKGMVANFGAATAVARASELEYLGRTGTTADLGRQFRHLVEAIAELSAALRHTFGV